MLDWQRRIEVPERPLCEGQAIFMEYRAGRLSHEDYLIMNAALVHKLLHEFHPRQYPVLLPVLRNYVTGRAQGTIQERDQTMAPRMGEWWRGTYAAKDANDVDASQLKWAAYILEGKLDPEAKRVREVLQEYYDHPFPSKDYEAVLIAMEKDARDRQRSAPQ